MRSFKGLTRGLVSVAALCVAGWAVPIAAQVEPSPQIRATDAEGALMALRQAGYKAEAQPREGDNDTALIEITTRDGAIFVQFSDCDEAVPEYCETLVLSTSWNRNTPMTDDVVAESNRRFKYVSIWKDEEGDPIMQWAILTGDAGIAQLLFLNAVQRYLDVVRDFDTIAFDDDGSDDADGSKRGVQETAAAAAPAAAEI
ncbi:YbjN domain-containing protein [Erythrobacter sp. R86502]|uniref:YbjN domain-containing protein n=1 Tax=Erythrobacter sp. R86502 TaxID=3093846 RepID=UPI0036D3E6F3